MTPQASRRAPSWVIVLLLALALAACGPGNGEPGDDDDDGTPDNGGGVPDEAVWDWCPEASDTVTDPAWQQTLVVAETALYCASFREYRPLADELAKKAMIRLIEGTYPLPHEAGGATMALSHCYRVPEGEEVPRLDGSGNVYTSSNDWMDRTYFTHQLEQPLPPDSGDAHWLVATLAMDDAAMGELPSSLVLDGTAPSPFEGPSFDLELCPDDPQSCGEGRRFLACNPQSYTLQRHRVVFSGGEVELDLRMGQSLGATEPAAFVRAAGSLDGEDFAQLDYWKLLYSPEHHHISRNFAVLFDSPIGEACGIQVEHLDPWLDPPDAVVHTVDCALAELDERAVEADSYELP